jgi:hypothetical protein
MHEDEDAILVRELGALASAWGGGARLTGLVNGRLKKNVHEIDLVLRLPFEAAVERVTRMLEQDGRRIEPSDAEAGAERHTVRIVTGGGTGGLNPVVVTALVARRGERDTDVTLRAAAKEGLIKQRAGEKTAMRLAALLGG